MFDDLRDLYSDAILAHAKNPVHAGQPEGWTGKARGDNPMCGDRVTVYVRKAAEAVEAAGFEARGCELMRASADLMCDAVAGQGAGAARELASAVEAMARTGQIPPWDEESCPACGSLRPLSAVHEFPSRVRCVTLPWTALVAALDEEKGAPA